MSSNQTIKIKTITSDGEVVGKREKKYFNPFGDNKGYKFKYKSTNVKRYLDIPLPVVFSDTEIGKIARLSNHIYSNTNLLAKRSNGKLVPYSREDIQEVIGLCSSKFSPFLNKVIEFKVLGIVNTKGNEYYCFNPIYFNSTDYINLELYKVFKEDLDNHVPEWVVNRYSEWGNKQ